MSTPPRDLVVQAVNVMYYESVIGLTITAILLAFVAQGIWEKRAELHFWRYPVHRAIVWILCLLLTTLLYFLFQCLSYARQYEEVSCNALVSPWLPLFWMMSKQFTYIFFYERSLITSKSLRLRSNVNVQFRRGLKFTIVVGIPLAFYWTFWAMFKGRVLVPEGCCVLVTTNQGPVIALAVVDFVLSSCLLFLFIFPLRHHVRSIRKSLASPWDSSSSHGEDLIMRVLRRNLVLGVIAMSTTFIALVAMDVLLTVAHDTAAPRDMEHMQIYATTAIGIDLLVSAITALRVTNFWKPELLAQVTWTSRRQLNTPGNSREAEEQVESRTRARIPLGDVTRDMREASSREPSGVLSIYRIRGSTQVVVVPPLT